MKIKIRTSGSDDKPQSKPFMFASLIVSVILFPAMLLFTLAVVALPFLLLASPVILLGLLIWLLLGR